MNTSRERRPRKLELVEEDDILQDRKRKFKELCEDVYTVCVLVTRRIFNRTIYRSIMNKVDKKQI